MTEGTRDSGSTPDPDAKRCDDAGIPTPLIEPEEPTHWDPATSAAPESVPATDATQWDSGLKPGEPPGSLAGRPRPEPTPPPPPLQGVAKTTRYNAERVGGTGDDGESTRWNLSGFRVGQATRDDAGGTTRMDQRPLGPTRADDSGDVTRLDQPLKRSTVAPDATRWDRTVEPGEQSSEVQLPRGSEESGRLGPYDLVRELGRGGIGVVFRAAERATGQEVALKVVLGERLTATQRERFLREGQLTATLTHPGIVRVLNSGEVEEIPYLAYELVEGARTLEAASSTATREQRLTWIRDAARALGHAHQQGVVHRDVKPTHILVDATNQVRVTDFGPGLNQGLEQLTRIGAKLATPAYLAPEQIDADRGQQGPQTDVWALGVLLYEAATDTRPFPGETLAQLSIQICRADPIRPSAHAKVSRPLEAICIKALSVQPADRYPDGEALAQDLDRFLRGERVSAQPPDHEPRLALLLARLLALTAALAIGAALWVYLSHR